MFMGFIDGDGYICVGPNRKGKYTYIKLCLVISLDIRDTELLEYFYSILKCGKIKTYSNISTVKYVIHKNDIKTKIIPLIDASGMPFLTKRRQGQYKLAKYVINNNITH